MPWGLLAVGLCHSLSVQRSHSGKGPSGRLGTAPLLSLRLCLAGLPVSLPTLPSRAGQLEGAAMSPGAVGDRPWRTPPSFIRCCVSSPHKGRHRSECRKEGRKERKGGRTSGCDEHCPEGFHTNP